ncbi:hypothetical protein PRZ48_007651 [Zasmidium cellare]|uniref:Uncharacterized protein n=1 Tax=Zasmidium cellare TaxID=395010 RepID=A0ABR0EJW5_ZASCE|nr:hypothetical protein PRZ48_007651 [Zasmidium cellare]
MYDKSYDFDTQSLSSTAPLLDGNDSSSTYQTPRAEPPVYYFYRGNGLTSKARIAPADGRDFYLDADVHQSKDSNIKLLAGKNTKGSSLGAITFPLTHNNFHITLNEGLPMIQARARVGHPHPAAYNIKLPATSTSQAREVSWTLSSRTNSKLVSYKLCDDMNRLIATWSLVSDQKYQAVLRWHVTPPSELEEAVVLLSFIGGLSRLKLKGKGDVSDMRSTMTRYNGFWFMAILGTAGVA